MPTKSVQMTMQTLLANLLGIEESEVLPNSHIQNDLGADSLDMVEVIMSMEEEFDLEIPDDDAEKIHTVQEAIDYVLKRTKH